MSDVLADYGAVVYGADGGIVFNSNYYTTLVVDTFYVSVAQGVTTIYLDAIYKNSNLFAAVQCSGIMNAFTVLDPPSVTIDPTAPSITYSGGGWAAQITVFVK
jgi:hypothetical protein